MTQLPGPAFDGLYGQMIMDHYRTPRNRTPLPASTLTAYELNPFCGDLIDLHLHFDADGAVDAVYANSEGCSIIQASASMMSEAVQGKTQEPDRRPLHPFQGLSPGTAPPTSPQSHLPTSAASEPSAWSGSTPSASSAPLLPWTALEEAIRGR